MTLRQLIIRYTAFAVAATLVNLATQRLVLLGGDTQVYFFAAVAAGTFTGLVVKYLLDKRWIFFDNTRGVKGHGTKFGLYTAMGLVTTVIFWGTETLFWVVGQTHVMRELGAVTGLAIGYVIKYQLDRRFVFTDGRLNPEPAI
ncbi:MAG: GtrA family protein [Cyanobacteria bacterium J06638_22]